MSISRELQITALEDPRPKIAETSNQYRVIPARYPMRTIGTIFAAIMIMIVLYSVFTNPRWGWDVFAEWFFAEPV